MNESAVESRFRKSIKALGGWALKFVSPGCSGVPDRIVLLPIPPEDRGAVAKYFWFVELKAPGKKPRPEQVRRIKQLRALGYKVEVIDEVP